MTPEQERTVAEVTDALMGKHKKWLEQFAHNIDISYDELMAGAKAYIDYDEYMVDGGKFEGVSVPAEFWEHYQAITTEVVPKNKQDGFFSCSC